MPDLCCNVIPVIARWHHIERSSEPVWACMRCGRNGWREEFDEQARALDRRLFLPLPPGFARRGQRHSAAFIQEAVATAQQSGGRSLRAVAYDLEITRETLSRWVRDAAKGRSEDPGSRAAGARR